MHVRVSLCVCVIIRPAGFLVQAGKHVSKLSADSVALQSDTHANTPWPWDDFSVAHFDISALLKLPDPGGGDGLRVIRCAELSLGGVTTEVSTVFVSASVRLCKYPMCVTRM